MSAALLSQVKALRRRLADGDGCSCRPLVIDRDGPYGTTAAPRLCPRCGRPPRLLALGYIQNFYDHAQHSAEATS
jgi:hypothetical protein